MKKKLFIKPGCIGCGLCQAVAPEVFNVKNVSEIKKDIDYPKYEKEIKEAVALCPVSVIVYEDEK